jgi:hypothetical protein
MLQEYAVEPRALCQDINQLKHLLGLFGLDRGRYISKFPSDWLRQVYSAMPAGLDRSRAEILLRHARDEKVFNRNRDFDPAANWFNRDPWLSNALTQHAACPFRAIISTSDLSDQPSQVAVNVVDEQHELLKCRTSTRVKRTAETIASELFPMALISRRIAVIDPFFDFRLPTPKGHDYRSAFELLLRLLVDAGRSNFDVEVHWRNHDTRPPLTDENLRLWTREWLPDGVRLHVYEWAEDRAGEDFHDRFLLGDNGGIALGAGWEVTHDNERVQLSLLSREDVESHWRDYTPSSSTFTLVYPAMGVDSSGATWRVRV